MQSSHLIVLVAVVVQFEKMSPVSEQFFCIRLLFTIIDEELDEHTFLAFVNAFCNHGGSNCLC